MARFYYYASYMSLNDNIVFFKSILFEKVMKFFIRNNWSKDVRKQNNSCPDHRYSRTKVTIILWEQLPAKSSPTNSRELV